MIGLDHHITELNRSPIQDQQPSKLPLSTRYAFRGEGSGLHVHCKTRTPCEQHQHNHPSHASKVETQGPEVDDRCSRVSGCMSLDRGCPCSPQSPKPKIALHPSVNPGSKTYSPQTPKNMAEEVCPGVLESYIPAAPEIQADAPSWEQQPLGAHFQVAMKCQGQVYSVQELTRVFHMGFGVHSRKGSGILQNSLVLQRL